MKIFVMGMHRSGTSMVTGLLHMCGMVIGNNLLMGARDNPKGHFEDKTFLNLNNHLLRLNGGSWHNPPKDIRYKGLKIRMQEFLAMWDPDDVVGWKDPRICLTFPLWERLINDNIKVVITDRSFLEVAKSLKSRNGFSIQKGKRLAKYYYQKAYENTKNQKRIITFFPNYFSNWVEELSDVLDFLGLKLPKDERRLEKMKAFIDPKLWHFRKKN